MITQEALDKIVVLYRQSDTMALYGIPYKMRPGQCPRNLRDAYRDWEPPLPGWYGSKRIDLSDWIWLGSPGWYCNMTPEEQELVKAFVAKWEAQDAIPKWPNDWIDLTDFT